MMPDRNLSDRTLVVWLATVLILSAPAPQTYGGIGGVALIWEGDDGTLPMDWGTGENWDFGFVPGPLDCVIFPGSASTFTVELNGNRTVDAVAFQDTTGYTLNGGGDTLTIGLNEVDVQAGAVTHTIHPNIVLPWPGSASFDWDIGTGAALFGGGTISESGGSQGLYKSGAGTLNLGGANTYTGVTVVSAGTLLVSNSSGSATGTGAVSVASDGTLGGTGWVDGAVSVAGGTIAPGSSTGVLSVGSANFDPNSTLEIELTGNGGSPARTSTKSKWAAQRPWTGRSTLTFSRVFPPRPARRSRS